MAYRGAPLRPTRIAWGPFPTRWAAVIALALAAVFGLVLLRDAVLSVRSVTCTAGPGATCSVANDGRVWNGDWSSRSFAFPRADLRGAHVEAATHGRTMLVIEVDSGDRAVVTADADLAQQAAQEIQTAQGNGGAFSIVFEAFPLDVFAAGMALLFLGAGGACWEYGRGRLLLDVVEGGTRLRVSRNVFGRALLVRELWLDDVTDVVVVPGALPETARIELVFASGTQLPLVVHEHAGLTLHQEAATQLRRALRLGDS